MQYSVEFTILLNRLGKSIVKKWDMLKNRRVHRTHYQLPWVLQRRGQTGRKNQNKMCTEG